MRNLLTIIKHEIAITVRKKSFWILSFIVPVMMLGLQGYYILVDNDITVGNPEDQESEEVSEPPEMTLVGLVDASGLIAEMPQGIPPGMFQLYSGLDEGRAALEAGEIDQLVFVPSDYVSTGDVTIYAENFQVLNSGDMGVAFGSANEWMLPYIINYNLIGDEALAGVVFNPTPGNQANYIPMEPEEEGSESGQALAEFTSTAIPYIYYFILIIVSGYILQSVTMEKENRTVEVILVSLGSDELMAGKLLGMTAIALVQLAVWVGGAALILN
ncbi:MAG: ABC transporter permease, partial [Candidatus Promineifilaceae bacterium]